jgi:hypothetical protein
MCLLRLNIKQIFALIIIFTLVACDNKKEIKLCTDPLLDELVDSKYEGNKEVKALWQKLKENRYVAEVGSDAKTCPKFMTLQFLFESALSSMMKYGKIRNVVAVTHTPYLYKPLRTDGTNINKLVPQNIISDPERINTLVMRFESIHDYLSRGGKLYVIYKNLKEKEKMPGFDVYKDNLAKYPSKLIDMPINEFNKSYSGISYLVECEDGEKMLFSITDCLLDNAEDREWSLYYGSIREQAIYGHYQALKHLYKNHNVDFDFK